MIEIEAPARVHLSLIGLSKGGYRINGGAGFAIDAPSLLVRAHQAPGIRLRDGRENGLSGEEVAAIQRLLERESHLAKLKAGADIDIAGLLPAHRGLGGGTALRLAALEALYALNETRVERSHLIAASGRGGTSGVGITTYFDGGFTFDIGHGTTDAPRPSNAWEQPRTPLQVARIEMPDWRIGLCSPPWIKGPSRERELELFEKSLPIAHSEVERTLYHVLYGVYASAIERDKDSFEAAVTEVQKGAWKRAEWDMYGPELIRVANELRRSGARSIGLTSMGPTLYFLADTTDISQLSPEVRHSITITQASNRGRKLREVQ